MEEPFCPACGKTYDDGSAFCPVDGTRLISGADGTITGQVLEGRYRILHKVGEGGMGSVYKAEHISTGKRVAIKVIGKNLSDDPDVIKRFHREVKLQTKLSHPNIVSLTDFSKTPTGEYYFAMEFVEGKSLHKIIGEKGAFSPEGFYELSYQMLDALDYAHSQGIVHRDLKCENIIVADIGRQRIVKILDFGLAKAAPADNDSRHGTELTQIGDALGTPAYMSPEQAKGEIGKIGPPSDIYSMGVVFYMMLTGRLPFECDNSWAYMYRQVVEPPPPFRKDTPGVSEELERVVLRCLEKRPEDRYPSALAVKEALLKAAALSTGRSPGAHMNSSRQKTWPSPPPAPPKQGIMKIWLSLLALVALVFLFLMKTGEDREDQSAKKLDRIEQMHMAAVERAKRAGKEQTQKEQKPPPGETPDGKDAAPAEPARAETAEKQAVKQEEPARTPKPAGEPERGVSGQKEAISAKAAQAQKEAPEKKESVPAGMAFIVGGCFDMGDTFGDGEKDEKPAHKVCLDGFYMDKNEVTQKEFMSVMGSNPSGFKRCGGDCPAEKVTWEEAREYCEKAGKRLPTEAEWEYAARDGGKKIKFGAGKNELGLFSEANFNRGLLVGPLPAGSFPPNGAGLYDMSGGVWEWVADWYSGDYYKVSPVDNPKGPDTGKERVIRGGGWAATFFTSSLRAAERDKSEADKRKNNIGFRCAR